MESGGEKDKKKSNKTKEIVRGKGKRMKPYSESVANFYSP